MKPELFKISPDEFRAYAFDKVGTTWWNLTVINSSAEYDYSGVIGGLWIHYRF